MTCQAKTENGTYYRCEPCGLSWDTDDPNNPPSPCRHGIACDVCEAEAADVSVGRFRLCIDPRCADVAKAWLSRQPDGSTYWQDEATKVAGKAGGKYLETIGKYDLASLTPDQWSKFCGTIVSQYRVELRRLGALKAPPF